MPRQFRFVGKIGDDTEVLFTTYGKLRELLTAGFEKEFALRNAEQSASVLCNPVSTAVAQHEAKSGLTNT